MIDSNTVQKIKNAPVEDRLQIIEDILQSLKNDIKTKMNRQKVHYKPFKIRKISLGKDIHIDRDELYSERGI